MHRTNLTTGTPCGPYVRREAVGGCGLVFAVVQTPRALPLAPSHPTVGPRRWLSEGLGTTARGLGGSG